MSRSPALEGPRDILHCPDQLSETALSTAQLPDSAPPGLLKFASGDDFYVEIRRRVERYFADSGQRPRDCPSMYFKTAVVLGWFAASYALLVFVATTWWVAVPLALSLGLAMAAIGFNIQHDAGHHAYSNRGWVNKLFALSLDLMGGSSYAWARKHNSIHHTFANITGHDDDIDMGWFGRLSPHQKRFPFHRLQHFYLWFLYGFPAIKWHFYDDFRDLARGHIGGHKFVRPRGWNLVAFFGGKAIFFTLALVVPMLFHPVWAVLLFYVIASLVQGLALSLVIQLAHCVEEANFPIPSQDTGRMETTWAAHQVETTVDFGRGNRLLSWYAGGLNFQIEHHLFPQVCHVHYPALAPLVESTCAEFGLRYAAHNTYRSALASHYRWLRRMGTESDSAI
jgi:linoleoyl-CoA desaturase